MLLLLLVCLMKIVDMSAQNRPRRCGGSKENCEQNSQQLKLFQQQQQLILQHHLQQQIKKREYQKSQKHHNGHRTLKQELRPLRGMTEHLTNDKNISHLPQLNHNSHHHSTTKKPQLSPNTAYGFTHFNYQSYDNNKSSFSNFLDDGLTEENLKKNVQIVLKNLDRYSNVLQSIILNEQTGISYNNNSMANIMSSPESDFNSNPPHQPFGTLNCSIASSHDFTHDNSDYQWFLDYGYRDGVCHQSVLSSLSASYNGIGEFSYYDDFAKNIDANLAEVDMESFRAEDIHSLLTHIPSLCKNKHRNEHNEIDSSICKSELLFSPVKESHISIDSLDLESYPEDGDIILTCKANKDNYTIAFEGSALYSDESYYAEPTENHRKKENYINLHNNLDDIVKQKALEVSMSRSDHAFTTWSKLKKSSTSQLQRYPSGNNNTSITSLSRHAPNCIVHKSLSLPNLHIKKGTSRQLNVSQAINNSTVTSCKSRNLLPMCQMPISSSGSESPFQTSNAHSSDSSSKQNQPAFNLVKLFIKQKSGSSETCMDVSSGCWPSDISSSLEQKTQKKSLNDSGKGSALSRHDEEVNGRDIDSSYQLDSLDTCDQNIDKECTISNSTSRKCRNDLYQEVFETQNNRHYIKENAMNMRNQKLKNVQIRNLTVHNNNNSDGESNTNKSLTDTSRTSENITQVFCNNNSQNRIKFPVDTITRSIQTSLLLKDKLRFVPPSFLANLNKLGEEKSAKVYVIYPSYALPDLGFVKNNLSDIILTPFNHKYTTNGKRRQTSIISHEEEEVLKNINYNHIADWKSLVTLLPVEYRKRLKHIPEADVESSSQYCQRPLFCMTPPLRRTTKSNFCDCAAYFQTCTSSSGSSQPPSSGYRGSSTLLTESELENTAEHGQNRAEGVIKNMYIYQYDNNRIENEVVERPPPSGRTPRSILRRNLRSARMKRNSMFEGDNTESNVKNLEKRRSLQEPYYTLDDHNYLEFYMTEGENFRTRQYYEGKNIHQIETTEMHSTENNIHRRGEDIDARARAENFLSNVPRSELKYYAEIANILESADSSVQYDPAQLKNEVSRALSQKKVSFNKKAVGNLNYVSSGHMQNLSTPPNSPNVSMAALRVNRTVNHKHRLNQKKEISAAEKEKQEKISSNKFKRLQIQWELLSKDSSMMLKDLAREKQTQSGGSTPTSIGTQKSRIPRPVSYPSGKDPNTTIVSSKTRNTSETKIVRSPSRIVPPKKYTLPPMPSATVAQSAAVKPKTPCKLTNTPKKRIPSPRTTNRNR